MKTGIGLLLAVVFSLSSFSWLAVAGDAPTITQQPVSLALIASEDAHFTVVAAGEEPLAYQWQLEREAIPGANEAACVVNSTTPEAHAGGYCVVVSNAHGSVTSEVAVLTVDYPRALVEPVAGWISVAEGGLGGPVSFSPAPLPHPPIAYQWRLNGTNLPGQTGSNLTIEVLSSANAGTYSLWVQTTNGGTTGPDTPLEIITVSAAHQQWETNEPSLGGDLKMLADEAGNFILVTHDHFGLTKLDPLGNVLWATNYPGPRAVDAVRDQQGNIVLTGYQEGPRAKYTTVKFNADGQLLWVAEYGPLHPCTMGNWCGESYAKGVAVDGAGNVYITGGSTGTNTTYPYDIATIKYDPDGNQLWVRRFDRGQHDYGYDIALDSQTNVVVTGDPYTVKYDRDGDQLWWNWGNGRKVAIDSEDNIYIAGGPGSSKLNKTNGEVLEGGIGGGPGLVDLFRDPVGNLVAVTVVERGAYDYWFDLDLRKANGVEGRCGTLPGIAYAATADRAGNIYVTGLSGRLFIAKWNRDGQRAWVITHPVLGGGTAIAVDRDFNISVAGDGGLVCYEQKPRLHLLGFQADGHLRLTLTGEPLVPVWLYGSTNLPNWEPLAPLSFSVSTADYTDMAADEQPMRFYKARSPAP